ncbi:MAG: hypothetical protein KBS81_04120 [Spirochaetales bacterium]|nr:hypothetical protein [Candidatus Physcosoma equi]
MRQNYKKDEASSRISKKETLKRILQYCAEYKGRILFISVIAVISIFFKAIIPIFTERAIDVDIASGDARGLVITTCLALGSAVLWGITAIIRDKMTVQVANEVVYK